MKDGDNWNCKFFDMPEFLDDIYDNMISLFNPKIIHFI